MNDFIWPSDQDRAENDELNRVCERLEEVEDKFYILADQWDCTIVDAKRCAAVIAFPLNYQLSEYQAFAKRVIANIEKLSQQDPTASLARRDLIKQAEVLEEFADNANPNCEAQDSIVGQAYDDAETLRQKAKEL